MVGNFTNTNRNCYYECRFDSISRKKIKRFDQFLNNLALIRKHIAYEFFTMAPLFDGKYLFSSWAQSLQKSKALSKNNSKVFTKSAIVELLERNCRSHFGSIIMYSPPYSLCSNRRHITTNCGLSGQRVYVAK